MTEIIILIISLPILVYFIFFNNKTTKNKNTYTDNSFELIFTKTDVIIQENEQVKLWRKPNSNKTKLFAKGYHSGEGLIGITTNKRIKKHLDTNNKYNAFISKINKNTVHISITLNQ